MGVQLASAGLQPCCSSLAARTAEVQKQAQLQPLVCGALPPHCFLAAAVPTPAAAAPPWWAGPCSSAASPSARPTQPWTAPQPRVSCTVQVRHRNKAAGAQASSQQESRGAACPAHAGGGGVGPLELQRCPDYTYIARLGVHAFGSPRNGCLLAQLARGLPLTCSPPPGPHPPQAAPTRAPPTATAACRTTA